MVRLRDAIEVLIFKEMTITFFKSNHSLAFLAISLHVIIFHTCRVATISLLKLACIVV
jgi:hypothetical protein